MLKSLGLQLFTGQVVQDGEAGNGVEAWWVELGCPGWVGQVEGSEVGLVGCFSVVEQIGARVNAKVTAGETGFLQGDGEVAVATANVEE